jgi:hypothetical protein
LNEQDFEIDHRRKMTVSEKDAAKQAKTAAR